MESFDNAEFFKQFLQRFQNVDFNELQRIAALTNEQFDSYSSEGQGSYLPLAAIPESKDSMYEENTSRGTIKTQQQMSQQS